MLRRHREIFDTEVGVDGQSVRPAWLDPHRRADGQTVCSPQDKADSAGAIGLHGDNIWGMGADRDQRDTSTELRRGAVDCDVQRMPIRELLFELQPGSDANSRRDVESGTIARHEELVKWRRVRQLVTPHHASSQRMPREIADGLLELDEAEGLVIGPPPSGGTSHGRVGDDAEEPQGGHNTHRDSANSPSAPLQAVPEIDKADDASQHEKGEKVTQEAVVKKAKDQNGPTRGRSRNKRDRREPCTSRRPTPKRARSNPK